VEIEILSLIISLLLIGYKVKVLNPLVGKKPTRDYFSSPEKVSATFKGPLKSFSLPHISAFPECPHLGVTV
jgi:hypothetical protein